MKGAHSRTHSHTNGGKIMIDEIAYASALRQTSPFLKIIISCYGLIVCLVFKICLVSALVLFCMLFAIIAISKMRWHQMIQLLKIPLSFILLGCIMLLIVFTKDAEQSMFVSFPIGDWYIGITGRSLSQFSELFVRCFAAVSCMFFLSTTTPMTELFTALRRMHFPGFLVEIMELVYRYIFVLLEIASQIRNAQECRLGYATLKTSFYSAGQLIANLFIRAYKQAERTYMAMESRGYTGDLKTLQLSYITKPSQIMISIVYMLCITVIAVACHIWRIGG